MSVWQLLFAFVACTGYALAQGRLLGARAKGASLGVTLLAAAAFVVESERWVDGFVLMAVAVAALGVFVALVWSTSHLLGMNAAAMPRGAEPLTTLPPVEPDSGTPGRPLTPPPHAAPSH